MSGHRPAEGPARLAVLTVSDTRTPATDVSGDLARTLLREAGHLPVASDVLPDDPGAVKARVEGWLADPGLDGVITTGGTGIAPRDRTYEALSGLLDRRLDGFGELFRMLSWQEVGSAAMLSRAVGGVARGKLLFCLPGSPGAVRLGLTRLVLPELAHLLGELRRTP